MVFACHATRATGRTEQTAGPRDGDDVMDRVGRWGVSQRANASRPGQVSTLFLRGTERDESSPDLAQGRAIHRERDPGHDGRGAQARRDQPGAGHARFPRPARDQGRGLPRDRRRHQPVRDHLGRKNLREAVAEHAEWHLGLHVDPETEITVTCGSTEAMLVALLSLINPGDEVILTQPFYENYWPDCVLAGATPRFVPLRPPGWRFDPDELAAAFNDKTKAIVLCNPNNPTGTVFSRADLEEVAASLPQVGRDRHHRRDLRAHHL